MEPGTELACKACVFVGDLDDVVRGATALYCPVCASKLIDRPIASQVATDHE